MYESSCEIIACERRGGPENEASTSHVCGRDICAQDSFLASLLSSIERNSYHNLENISR